VAQVIRNLGYKVAIISRGYKGGAEKTGGIVSNGHTILMEPDKAGDEPFMMASKLKDIPVVVGQNRFEAGCLTIQEFNPDVSALKRSDAFVLTRSDSAPDYIRQVAMDKIKNLAPGKPVFRSFYVPNLYKPPPCPPPSRGRVWEGVKKGNSYTIELQNFDSGLLHGRKVVAFSGLARNNDFRRTVENLKCDLIDFFEFPDHHKYTKTDLQTIMQSSINAQAEFILTTEKDYVRISGETSWPVELVVVGIELSLGDYESAFIDFIKNRLEGIVE
jgi:tetraacyldisaccharide 4'-kinase